MNGTILVTGATGFLGARLVQTLLARCYPVRILVRCSTPRSRATAARLTALGAEPVSGDVRRPETLPAALEGVTAVFHLVGRLLQPGVPNSEYESLHVAGTANLLRACEGATGLARFIHCSTTGVVGPASGRPLDETAPHDPGTCCEATKAAGEELALMAIRDRGLPVCVVRPALEYAPGDVHLLRWFRSIQRGLYPVIGSGGNLMHPIDIDDLAAGMLACLERPAPVGGVYHLVGERVLPIRELAEAIAAALECRLPRGRLPIGVARAAPTLIETLPIPPQMQPLTRHRAEGYSGAPAPHRSGQIRVLRRLPLPGALFARRPWLGLADMPGLIPFRYWRTVRACLPLERGRVLRSTLANYAGRLFLVGSRVVLTPLILHYLGPAHYGLWVLVNSLTMYGALLDLGIAGAVTQYVAEHQARGDFDTADRLVATALCLYSLLALAAAILGLALAPLFPRLFNVPPEDQTVAVHLAQLYGLWLGIIILGAPVPAVLRGLQRFDLMNVLTAVGAVLAFLFQAGPLLAAWVGPGYAPYAPLVVILGLATMIETSQWPAASVLHARNRPWPLALVSAGTVLANLLLSLTLFRPLGLTGIALGTLIPTAVAGICLVLPFGLRSAAVGARQALHEIFRPAILPAVPAGLLLYGLRQLWAPQSLVALALAAGAAALLYGLVYLALSPSPAERELASGAVRAALARPLGRCARRWPRVPGTGRSKSRAGLARKGSPC